MVKTVQFSTFLKSVTLISPKIAKIVSFKVLGKIRESSLDTHLLPYDVKKFSEFLLLLLWLSPA